MAWWLDIIIDVIDRLAANMYEKHVLNIIIYVLNMY